MMKEWTREERYRELTRDALGELQQLHETVSASPYRCTYHVQTVTGLLGDTNGFSYFKDRWHLFFQWFPYGPVHGLKHWYHVSGPDLIRWENEGVALIPDRYEDNKGDFSGSGFACGDKLYLPFTGNHRDEDWTRTPYQLLAVMDEDGNITKQDKILYGPVEGYTEHQRDPKLFYRKEDDSYYFLLGAQDMNKKGKFLLFRSKQIEEGWELLGELKVRGYDDFGFMVECPDLERVGDDWLLLFSPQGVEPQEDEFRNIYQNVYFIGQMDFDNLEFIPNGPYKELDRGFDFYAAQCAGQDVMPDAAVMCAWFGVSDYVYEPQVEHGYSGLQTMARVMTIEDGKLMQRPPKAVYGLKDELLLRIHEGKTEKDILNGRMEPACLIRADNIDDRPFEMCLFCTEDQKGFTVSCRNGKLTVEREEVINKLNTAYGTDRSVRCENGLHSLEIFVDHSCIEIFVNDGEYVLSARVFPCANENGFRAEGLDELAVYRLNASVKDDFVIFPDQKQE